MITPGEQQPDTTLTETKPDSSLPAAPGELEQKVKEQKWQQASGEVDKIVDRLGKGIDTGIKETVVALKVMDIGATQSCEGHLDWGTRAPWVEIGASDVREMEDRMFDLFQRGQQQDANHVAPEDLDKIFDEAHQLRREVEQRNLEPARKAMQYLSEFYETRNVHFDRRLTLQKEGTRSRIESQGAMFQETATPEERQQKLGEYQEEMRAFTGFLKNKHFGNTAPSPIVQAPMSATAV